MDHRKILHTSQFLEQLHQMVEQHLNQSIAVYQNLSDNDLNKTSLNGGWSITQCLDHLNSYSHYYMPLLTRAVKQYPAKPVQQVKRGWLGNYFIKMMDADLKAAKYKALKKHLPAIQLNAHNVVAEFIKQQEELIQLLNYAALTDLNTIRIPTSINRFIRLRLGDTLAFLIVHNERHIRQANQNIV